MAALYPIPGGSIIFLLSPFLLVLKGFVLAYNELSGSGMGYSKFTLSNKLSIPSKVGMFLAYFPSALVGSLFLAYGLGFLPVGVKSCGDSIVASLLQPGQAAVNASDSRLLLVAAAVLVHFSKRCLEVLFIHKYSGQMNVSSVLIIPTAYCGIASLLLFTQLMSTGLTPPSPDLRWLGLLVYLVGTTGNGYHHWLLSQLRNHGSKKYVVPQGGLFGRLVCPHYVCEMITFVGIALMSQTWNSWGTATFVVLYLTARSFTTKQWYVKKVDGYPRERSVLIPGVF